MWPPAMSAAVGATLTRFAPCHGPRSATSSFPSTASTSIGVNGSPPPQGVICATSRTSGA